MEQTQAEREQDYQYDYESSYEDSFETFVEHQEYFASQNLDEIIKRNKEVMSESSKIINSTVT